MSLSDYLVLAYKNVTRGRHKTVLSVISISIGIIAVILLNVISSTGKEVINSQLESIGINGIMIFSGDGGLTVADGERIESVISEVACAMPFDCVIGDYRFSNGRKAQATFMTVDENVSDFMHFNLLHGRLFTKNDLPSNASVCIVDSSIAEFGYKRSDIVGKKITLTKENMTNTYTIIGVINSQLNGVLGLLGTESPGIIYIPYNASALYPNSEVGQLALKLHDGSNSEAVYASVSALLKRTNQNYYNFTIENITGYRDSLDVVLDSVTYVLSATAAVSLVVAGIGVMSMMLSSVNERRCEIGICKAIGAGRGKIALIFLSEAAILALFGIALGMALGLGLTYILFGIFEVKPVICIKEFLIFAASTALICLLAGLIPALRASRLTPAEAIRKD